MNPNTTPSLPALPRRYLALGVLSVALVLVLATALPGLLSRVPEGGLEFVIPAGASAWVDNPTIDSAIEIPTSIVFAENEVPVISIRNEDTTAHRAGPWIIAPGQTFTLSFDEPGEYFYLCTVDASESVTIAVE